MRRTADNNLPPECFTIAEFCEAHRIGKSKYWTLRAKGLGPNEFRLDGKVLITKESAALWRAARDAEAKEQAS